MFCTMLVIGETVVATCTQSSPFAPVAPLDDEHATAMSAKVATRIEYFTMSLRGSGIRTSPGPAS